MSETPPLVALVDDDADIRGSIAQMLGLAGYRVTEHADAAAALAAVDDGFAGVVVSDVAMPGMSGVELFRRLHARDADLPVLLITGHGDVAMAVDALKAGAWDFITKPFDPDALLAAVGRAIAHRGLVMDNRRLRALAAAPDGSPLVGRSPAIVQLRDTVALLADADIDVLIEGESGTGKELLARLIHRGGARARHRFATVACAAMPDALIEPELIGGTIAAAARGTLFLDDVDRASPALQARLAQFAEERTVPGLAAGGDPMPVGVRLVATAAENAGGTMDPALYYRLSAVRLRVPPLRERLDDVPLLFAHLLDLAASRLRRPLPDLTPAVRRRLIEHRWPGNVRELAHFADQVMIGLAPEPGREQEAETLPDRVAAFERQAIVEAVLAAKGDAGAAMQALGLPRKTFYYKVQRHGIDLTGLRRAGAERTDGAG